MAWHETLQIIHTQKDTMSLAHMNIKAISLNHSSCDQSAVRVQMWSAQTTKSSSMTSSVF